MAGKNILADSDFTRKDNHFQTAVVVGKVSEVVVDEKGANVRVIMPDRVDHTGQPLITKPIPVWQQSAGKKRSFAVPRKGQNVVLVKLPNGLADYLCIGTYYTKNDPPPVTDPLLDYVIYDDGSFMKFDPNEGAGTLTWNFKGGIDITTQKDVTVNTQGKVTITAAGEVKIDASGALLTIKSTSEILLQGPVTIEGDITHTGNMATTGVHTDLNGVHT